MRESTGAVRALGSGVVGAITLTAVHEVARRAIPHAPRMDVIGMRALARAIAGVGGRPPRGERLFRQTLLGDLAANSLYYGVACLGPSDRALRRGLLAGAAAGAGAVVLPPALGLGESPGTRYPATPLMTVAWYTLGGLAAGTAVTLLGRRSADGGARRG